LNSHGVIFGRVRNKDLVDRISKCGNKEGEPETTVRMVSGVYKFERKNKPKTGAGLEDFNPDISKR